MSVISRRQLNGPTQMIWNASRLRSTLLRVSVASIVLSITGLFLYSNDNFFGAHTATSRSVAARKINAIAMNEASVSPARSIAELPFVDNVQARELSQPKRLKSEITPDMLRAAKPTDAATARLSPEQVVQSIDWESMRRFSPIPRAMPAGESDDPLEAGFAPQWIERALVGWIVESRLSDGRKSRVLAAPMALQIASEKKNPDDTWAYGVEYELRRVIQDELGGNFPITPRVFCNAHGCLCYFEGMTERRPLGRVTRALTSEPWAKDFGIDPLSIYWMNGGSGPKELHWQLVIVARRGEAQ